MSFWSWFFGTDKNNAHIGPPGAQGMIVVNNKPIKTVQQIDAEEAALPPRQWNIFEGHGHHIGTATEDKTTKRITVDWHAEKHPKRIHWVDAQAFRRDLLADHPESFPVLHGITTPVRIRYRPRTAEERRNEDIFATLGDDF